MVKDEPKNLNCRSIYWHFVNFLSITINRLLSNYLGHLHLMVVGGFIIFFSFTVITHKEL